jgi:hypothetical protein
VTEREKAQAARVIDRALAAGAPWREIYFDVLTPAHGEIGARWEAGDLDVAAEHLISAAPSNAPAAAVAVSGPPSRRRRAAFRRAAPQPRSRLLWS